MDRGRGGIKILQYMMMQPNMYPIIGNHEYALRQVLNFVTQEITEVISGAKAQKRKKKHA